MLGSWPNMFLQTHIKIWDLISSSWREASLTCIWTPWFWPTASLADHGSQHCLFVSEASARRTLQGLTPATGIWNHLESSSLTGKGMTENGAAGRSSYFTRPLSIWASSEHGSLGMSKVPTNGSRLPSQCSTWNLCWPIIMESWKYYDTIFCSLKVSHSPHP